MYKIRIILDTKEDVIRTIVVNNNSSLEELHQTISTSFGFNGQEMASFYRTNDDWNQGEEIPLFDMSEVGVGISMATCFLNETLPAENDKLIYVYNFLDLWSFYVEVIEISEEIQEGAPKIILTVGEIPEKAPTKEFTSEDPEKEELDDDFGFEDDFDFNNY